MNDTELRLAIDQAWHHVRNPMTNTLYEEARQHLNVLRKEQERRACSPASSEKTHPDTPKPTPPPTTEFVGKPTPPSSTTRKESEG